MIGVKNKIAVKRIAAFNNFEFRELARIPLGGENDADEFADVGALDPTAAVGFEARQQGVQILGHRPTGFDGNIGGHESPAFGADAVGHAVGNARDDDDRRHADGDAGHEKDDAPGRAPRFTQRQR